VCQQDDSLKSALDKSKGETLLSPLVMCGPHGLKFQLPVELKLPHHAAENADSWNLSLKSSSDATDQNQWQSINLNNKNGESSNKNTVSVLVDHF
jgi:tight junction protein 1